MYTKPPSNLNHPDARNHFQTKFSYMVPLYTGGKLTQYKNITNALHKMSRLDTAKLLNEKIFQTTKTFYDISLVDRYIENLGSIINNIDKLAEVVASMREEGFAKEIDQLEVKAKRAEVESMLSQATFNRVLAYQYLSFLVNSKIESIQSVSEKAPMPKVVNEDVKRDNLDIRKAKLGLKITDMAIKLQKSNFLPEVGAFGEYSSSDNSLFNEFLDKDSYTIGVQAKWNLFNGEIDKNNLEKAKVENLKVYEQVNLAKKGILLKVRKTLTEIKSKDADINSLDAQLEFATKVYETYQEQYKEGISSISDVLIKQSKELEVLLKLLTAKNERNTKVFELKSIIDQGEEI
jgi:outer membrane protein TolC